MPHRLPVDGLDELEGKSVHYSVRQISDFAGKRVVVVGGGNSAVDWLLNLRPTAAKLFLVHRRDIFRAHEANVQRVLTASDVEKHICCEVKAVHTDQSGRLCSVTIENSRTGNRTDLEADTMLINIGVFADIGPIKHWGLEMVGHSIVVNQRMETNLQGVYAAGDVTTFPGKVKLIATGVGEAATAVNMAKHYIDPTQKEQPIHSTTLFENRSIPH